MKENKGKAIALLPILVFLVLYLGTGLILEYVIKIEDSIYVDSIFKEVSKYYDNEIFIYSNHR